MNKKFKLNKVDNGYMLLEESSIGKGCFVLVATEKDKLDELNCDELFNFHDPTIHCAEQLQKRKGNTLPVTAGFIEGYHIGWDDLRNLSKEKRYTFDELVEAAEYCRALKDDTTRTKDLVSEYARLKADLESEIMVELVTEPMNMDEIRAQGKGFLNANTNKPKLTAEGKWILKRLYS